jgi:hypothetical protein
VRAIKVPAASAAGGVGGEDLEALQGEDYGQSATYDGTIPGFPHAFSLGRGGGAGAAAPAVFITGEKTPVDAGTAAALAASRYGRAFRITARKDHRGPFGGGGGGGGGGLPAAGLYGAGMAAAVGGGDEDGEAPACCPPPAGKTKAGSGCC